MLYKANSLQSIRYLNSDINHSAMSASIHNPYWGNHQLSVQNPDTIPNVIAQVWLGILVFGMVLMIKVLRLGVPRIKALPQASFRFHLTVDTLAFG